MTKEGKKMAKKLLKEMDMKGAKYDDFQFKDLTEASEEEMSKVRPSEERSDRTSNVYMYI